MSAQQNGHAPGPSADADFAQAFQELSRGERTAQALEDSLGALEARIDELVAAADAREREMRESRGPAAAGAGGGGEPGAGAAGEAEPRRDGAGERGASR
ncbi:hypothetical protein BDY21DRAFT_372193 [Lineolata rhizophorae]|uniref:Uncharacterized protein n=1 Tax=Lineolata rhizophorae TaxID=578093 RepID=A0A6A6NYC5_9PEZI|nr:hypothetical protein BDY21DRAFT_372193 [Lineolata rhizophorae]